MTEDQIMKHEQHAKHLSAIAEEERERHCCEAEENERCAAHNEKLERYKRERAERRKREAEEEAERHKRRMAEMQEPSITLEGLAARLDELERLFKNAPQTVVETPEKSDSILPDELVQEELEVGETEEELLQRLVKELTSLQHRMNGIGEPMTARDYKRHEKLSRIDWRKAQ